MLFFLTYYLRIILYLCSTFVDNEWNTKYCYSVASNETAYKNESFMSVTNFTKKTASVEEFFK